MGEKKIVSSILFIAVILSLGLALTNYMDPTGYPAAWPDNPSPALASFEFSTTADLLDYYPTGAWNVSGGLLNITSNGQSKAILNGSEAWTDYSLKVLARVVGEEAAGESSYKVFARTTGGASSLNGYAFEIDTNYSNRFAIKRIVNGIESTTLITSVTSTGFDWNQWQEISVTVIGNEFSMHINGIEVLRYTDMEDPYLSGNVGLGCDGSIQLEFDYARVYKASVDLREWIPYTYLGDPVFDKSGSVDSSSGGSVNPSHVDIVSTPSLPSVMVYFDSGVMMFRIVLGGNPLSLTGSGTPYTSSTWVVLIDIDGDGYRDFAVELDGTDSGNAPDDIRVFYGDINNQYLYDGDMLWKQDSARHRYNPTNSDGEPERPANWDVDPSPSVWDFSRTRVTEYSDPSAGKVYILDIQVPLSAFDATAVGGPKLTTSSVFQLAFTTSANTNNPVQKDLAYQGIYNMETNSPVLFGDPINTSGQISQIPLTSKITVTGCGPSLVEALVQDASILVDGQVRSSVTGVEFFNYFDFNENGLADDGFDWISIGNATSVDGFNPWRFSWDTSQIPRGNYLVKAVVVDYQGNTMDSYLQYTDGDLRQIALFENVCSSLSLSISGTVFEDFQADGYPFSAGTDLPKEGVRVRLYREIDGNGILSAGDSFLGETTTDSSGLYTFGFLPPYRYYVVVNSRDVSPSGINSGLAGDVVWAEQTYKREFFDGVYLDSQAFGGIDPEASDAFSISSTAVDDSNFEHLSIVDITGATETVYGIDHGFSFNVVVNNGDTGVNDPGTEGNQGSLRQFVLNSNAIAGENAIRFVLMTPQNSFSGENSWWTFKPLSALPEIFDAGTIIDGTVFSIAGETIDTNLSTFGGGVAGTDGITVPAVAGTEVEIDCNDLAYCFKTMSTASGFELRDVSFFNGGGDLGDQSAPVIIAGPDTDLSGLVIGSRADGARPLDDFLNKRFGIVFGSNGNLSNSYIAHNGSGLLLTGSNIIVTNIHTYDNAIGPSGTDGNGITVLSPANQITIRNSLVDLNGGSHSGVSHGNGIYTSGDSSIAIENLTVSNSSSCGVSLNLSAGAEVYRTVIHGSLSGPGIRVSNDSSEGQFAENSYYENRGLAIDLLRDPSTSVIEGVNENDGLLNSGFGNEGIDHPVITGASYSGSLLTIEGYVGDGTGSSVFSGATVEIYSALAGEGDAHLGASYGEGLKYVGSVLADANGTFSGTIDTGSQETVITGITILGNSTSEFGPNKQIGEGLAIEGFVFEDSNNNRVLDPGESGIAGVRVELWKYESGAWSMSDYAETESDGSYGFSVSQGSYRVVEDAQNLYDSSTGGSDPSGYISTTPNWIEVIVDSKNGSASFGDYEGFIVNGFVFDDSGDGLLENANNAVKNQGESGIAGAKIVLTNGLDSYTRYTDEEGYYRFFVSGSPSYPITITEHDPASCTSTGDFDSDGSDPYEERNRISIGSGIDSDLDYNFADVRRLLLSGINSSSGRPNSVVFFDHFLTVSTPGSVYLEAISAQAFETTIYEADQFGGIIEEWNQSEIRNPGMYYIRIGVIIPLDVDNGTVDSIILRALQSWANSSGKDSAATSDTLTVGFDGLVISKETRNFTFDSSWSLFSEGKPGDTIEYRISFSNNGSAPINSLKVTDPLDRNLLLLQNGYTIGELHGNVLLCIGEDDHLLFAEAGEDANFDYAFLNDGVLFIEVSRIVGALQPGISACILFKVRINE